MTGDPGPTVCYILSSGRSGSTLLGRILGQVEGCCDVGELSGLWRVRHQPGWRCGCGEELARCPFWTAVLAIGARGRDGTLGDVAPAEVAALRRAGFRTRHVPRLWWDHAVARRPAAPAYAGLLGALYRSVAGVSGAAVVVDSSKFPAEAVIAAGVDGVDLRVVHLVRDPRAVAFSWSRWRPRPGGTGDGRPMVRRPPAAVAAEWAGVHALAATVVRRAVGPPRYLRLRYEDLAAEPGPAVRRVLEHLGRPGAALPFAGPATVALAPTHTATGNPGRFAAGLVAVEEDDEWRRAMKAADRRLVTAVAAPVMVPLGYRLRTPKR